MASYRVQLKESAGAAATKLKVAWLQESDEQDFNGKPTTVEVPDDVDFALVVTHEDKAGNVSKIRETFHAGDGLRLTPKTGGVIEVTPARSRRGFQDDNPTVSRATEYLKTAKEKASRSS